MTVLEIARPAYMQMLRHAQEGREQMQEICGLVAAEQSNLERVVAAYRCRNVDPEPRTRYELDPADHIRILRETEAAGLDVVGAYHLHPFSPAYPSPTDVRKAVPAFYYVILSTQVPDRPALRAFKIDEDEQIQELEVRLVE